MSTPAELEAAAARAAADKAAQEQKDAQAAAAKAEEERKRKEMEDKLGEGGKAALKAERELRAEAERKAREATAAAREAQKKLDALEAEKLSDTEKLQKRAEQAEQRATAKTETARKANLAVALQAAGVANPAAAARLLDGVEFDDDTDTPTNLDARIAAAKAEFGEDLFKAQRRQAPDLNPGDGNGGGDGPKLTAEEQQAARRFRQTDEEYAWYRDNPNGGVFKPAEPAKT